MRPTLEEYEDLGRELSSLCFKLSECAIKIAVLTGTSKAPYIEARKASRCLDKCKSEAEDIFLSQYPELGREACRVFYRPKDGSK